MRMLFAFVLIFICLILFWIVSGIEKRRKLEEEDRARREERLRQSPCFRFLEDTENAQPSSHNQQSVTNVHPEDMAALIKKLIYEDASTEQERKGSCKEFTRRQKMAVLIVLIGSQARADLFKHLRKDEIDKILAEVEKVAPPDSVQIKAILHEFHDLMTIFLENK